MSATLKISDCMKKNVDLLTHSLPVIVVAWVAALLLLLFLFRSELAHPPQYADAVLKLDLAQAVDDPQNAKRLLIVLAGVLALFFLQGISKMSSRADCPERCSCRPGLDSINNERKLKRIEWNALLFFAGLFVMVGGLEASGTLQILTDLIISLKSLPPMLLGVILMWVVAVLSAVIDNIPITIAMIPVIERLGSAGIEIQPLWWALIFGAGLGGNATIIGSTANIVVVSFSEKTRFPITSALWNKRGLPVMLVTCSIASVLYSLFFG